MSKKVSSPFVIGVAVLGLLGIGQSVNAADINVNAEVSDTCALDSGDISFGTYLSGQTDDLDVTGAVSYRCSTGLDVDFELDGGAAQFAGTNGNRVMNFGQNSPLEYQLFSDSDRNQIWGTGALAVNEPSTSSGTQTIPVFARIPANQSVTANIAYSDTVIFSFIVN